MRLEWKKEREEVAGRGRTLLLVLHSFAQRAAVSPSRPSLPTEDELRTSLAQRKARRPSPSRQLVTTSLHFSSSSRPRNTLSSFLPTAPLRALLHAPHLPADSDAQRLASNARDVKLPATFPSRLKRLSPLSLARAAGRENRSLSLSFHSFIHIRRARAPSPHLLASPACLLNRDSRSSLTATPSSPRRFP